MILSRNGGGCPLCNCSMNHFAGSPVLEESRGNTGCCHATRCKGIIPCSWALFLNTANLPQMALVTQLPLPPRNLQAWYKRQQNPGRYLQYPVFIQSALSGCEKVCWALTSLLSVSRTLSQSIAQAKLQWQASNPCLCCLKLKHLKQKHLLLLHLSTYTWSSTIRLGILLRWAIYNVDESL